ncbi:MAG: DUF2490 domain-containing protein [Gammaproteobacteria bacterium]
MIHHIFILIVLLATPLITIAQSAIDEDDTGAWYMYFFSTRFNESQWGMQGDIQYRNWDLGGDLEQLLLRGGLTWTSQDKVATFTLGYGNITSGTFGSSSSTSNESRIYQEALIRQALGSRLKLRHRFRLEQRWVEDQDFRTRFRYAIFADIPLNNTNVIPGTWYVALYNEVFVNLEHDIGNGRSVETFDRNRLYAGIGYSFTKTMKVQGGYMHQNTSSVDKGQLQLSLHHSF